MSASERHRPLLRLARQLCGREVQALQRVGGGGNSRVYRVRCGRRSYALKCYPPGDRRDRLGVEAQALELMARHRVPGVPRLLAQDRARRLALLEWIAGRPPRRIGPGEVDRALEFLAAVKELSRDPRARELPAATECCLSAAEVVRQVRLRLERLTASLNGYRGLREFLLGQLLPALRREAARAVEGYRELGLDFARELEPRRQRLIPADFGFHNALRRPRGGLAFIDFEYFGWDDPVKLASDFLWHPAHQGLGLDLRRRFVNGMCRIHRDDPDFPRRLALSHPLFGLRWCAILLNEFLPERWANRAFAGEDREKEAVLARQLDRARRLLAQVQRPAAELHPGG